VGLACIGVIGLIALSGCGSSKPAYCSNLTTLQSSIKGLTGEVKSGGVSALETQLKKIESDATTLVNSAKSDFPNETSAITSSIDTLAGSVKALGSSPSAKDVLGLAPQAAGVVSSVKGFSDATNSKCS
jgi:hypothetical protein